MCDFSGFNWIFANVKPGEYKRVKCVARSITYRSHQFLVQRIMSYATVQVLENMRVSHSLDLSLKIVRRDRFKWLVSASQYSRGAGNVVMLSHRFCFDLKLVRKVPFLFVLQTVIRRTLPLKCSSILSGG